MRISLIFLHRKGVDIASNFVNAFDRLGCQIKVTRVPYFWTFSTRQLRELRALIKKEAAEAVVIFCPESTELFLSEPYLSLHFSGYRSWYDRKRMRVIPHVWGPIPAPTPQGLRWTKKPPLNIGFMGSTHPDSRLVRLMLNMPEGVKTWVLRGEYLKYPTIRAWLTDLGVSAQHLCFFARIEALRALSQGSVDFHDVELDVVERATFSAGQSEMEQYVDHLKRNTYILCPRGTENYSYRMYEALSAGRIPVIIDTDVVLPPEVSWDQLSLRISYNSLGNLIGLIRQDYHSLSDADFLERQSLAFETMRRLRTMRWADDIAREVLQKASDSSAKRKGPR